MKVDNPSETVQVMVRMRPMNKREVAEGSKQCVKIDKKVNAVFISESADFKNDPRQFTYDAVYDKTSTQREVYDEGAFPLVESVMAGYNGTIFAYG